MTIKNKKIKTSMCIFFIFLPLFAVIPTLVIAQTPEFSHLGDQESPLVVNSVLYQEMTWKVVNASGVFADSNFQPNNLIKLRVSKLATGSETYTVNASVKFWGNTTFTPFNSGFPINTSIYSYFLVARNWGVVAIREVVNKHDSFWGSKSAIDLSYNTKYQTEWYNGKLLNTATINFNMNETNYDSLRYSRSEGILLSRTARVSSYNGTTKGALNIELISYTGIFAESPWTIIIMGLLTFFYFIFIISMMSVISRKRSLSYLDREDVDEKGNKRSIIAGSVIAFIFFGLGIYQIIATFSQLFGISSGLSVDLSEAAMDVLLLPLSIVFFIIGAILLAILNLDETRMKAFGIISGTFMISMGIFVLILIHLIVAAGEPELILGIWLLFIIYPVAIVMFAFGIIQILFIVLKDDKDFGIGIVSVLIMIFLGIYFMYDMNLYIFIIDNGAFELEAVRLWIAIILRPIGYCLVFVGPALIALILLKKATIR